jgi:hypothetical protein
MSSQEIPIRIKPRVMPENTSDFCVGFLLVFPLQATALFVLPSLLVLLLSRSSFVAWAAPAIICLVHLTFSVWSIALTPAGIRFHRLLGTPIFLTWTSISSIEPVSRWELITKGWLWPLLPAREMTPSLTSLRHYRISWGKRFCYYPPADVRAFEEYVSR